MVCEVLEADCASRYEWSFSLRYSLVKYRGKARRGSDEVVPGPSVFPSREPSVLGNFCGRIKGGKFHVALQGGTWDFPGDTGNFGVPLE